MQLLFIFQHKNSHSSTYIYPKTNKRRIISCSGNYFLKTRQTPEIRKTIFLEIILCENKRSPVLYLISPTKNTLVLVFFVENILSVSLRCLICSSMLTSSFGICRASSWVASDPPKFGSNLKICHQEKGRLAVHSTLPKWRECLSYRREKVDKYNKN